MHLTSHAHDLSARDRSLGDGEAAFFGLDQTLIPGSSLFLLAQGLHERDLYGTREMLRFAWDHLRYRMAPADAAPPVQTSTEVALEFVAGRPRPEVEGLAREIAQERIVPLVYPAMARILAEHRSAGHRTYVATAAPAEVAAVVADGLEMTGALGTRAEVDPAGRYSGHLDGAVLHGPAKAAAVRILAEAEGIDLGRSAAYSDAISDLPLLELVGRPVAVNPDDRLRRVARDRGWVVQHVERARLDGRRPSRSVHHRMASLGLATFVEPDRVVTRGRTHYFRTDDPEGLVAELEATGRFRRDSRLGRVFHRGQISLRELSQRDSLHIIVGEGDQVAAHLDHVSPLASEQPDDGCRYSLPRIAAHNVTGMASDLARFVAGRRGEPCCSEESDDLLDELANTEIA